MTVAPLLSFSVVDIGDVSTETWQYVPLLAAQFWEAFGPQHPRCHIREIRITLEGAWKSRIFVWICRHIYQYFYLYFSKEKWQIACCFGEVEERSERTLHLAAPGAR